MVWDRVAADKAKQSDLSSSESQVFSASVDNILESHGMSKVKSSCVKCFSSSLCSMESFANTQPSRLLGQH